MYLQIRGRAAESTLRLRLLIRRERTFLVTAVSRQSRGFSISIVRLGLELEPAAPSARLSSFPGVLGSAPIFCSRQIFHSANHAKYLIS